MAVTALDRQRACRARQRSRDQDPRAADVRYWPLADIPSVAFDVAFGGKADMG